MTKPDSDEGFLHRPRPLFSLALAAVFLSGCSFYQAMTLQSAKGFHRHEIQAAGFLLTSMERVASPGSATAHVYIEGDGRAWVTKTRPARDPTPRNPLALKLALKLALADDSANVVYLARPCQYAKIGRDPACSSNRYWTSHRFAPEVIDAMSAALDALKRRHALAGFHLTGFSGGGAIAALLTARREDVVSLRTVAGNLDHALHSRIHGVSPMPHSLNARDIADRISHIPQIHFSGGRDKTVPPRILRSYAEHMRQTDCTRLRIVESAGHTNAWEALWPDLLRTELPVCGKTTNNALN